MNKIGKIGDEFENFAKLVVLMNFVPYKKLCILLHVVCTAMSKYIIYNKNIPELLLIYGCALSGLLSESFTSTNF